MDTLNLDCHTGRFKFNGQEANESELRLIFSSRYPSRTEAMGLVHVFYWHVLWHGELVLFKTASKILARDIKELVTLGKEITLKPVKFVRRGFEFHMTSVDGHKPGESIY